MNRANWKYAVVPLLGMAAAVLVIATLPYLTPQVQANSDGQEAPELIVVRGRYEAEDALDRLLAWKLPWEVDRQAQTVVIGIRESEISTFESLGFTVAVDRELTELYSQPLTRLPGQTGGIPGFACYRTVDETYTDAAQIAADHPDLAEWVDIGDSWEKTSLGGDQGHDLMVLVLTNENIGGDKPKLFIMASVHAREYAPAELTTRFAEYLVDNYGQDADVTWLLDYQEVHLLLQANPDGRVQAEARVLWRKNTNQNYCGVTSNFRGADLNRNFSFSWRACEDELCSSSNQCSETYRGPSAASEPETQAIETYTRGIFPDQRADDLTDPAPATAAGVFLDLHSYGGLVLWPWGFTETAPPNGTAIQTLGRKFAYFNGYQPQQAVDLYPTDGATDDFAYGELGVAAYTFEMGSTFFEDCSNFSNSILPDNLPALLYAAKASRAPYQLPAGPDVYDIAVSPGQSAPGAPLTLTATVDSTRIFGDIEEVTAQNISGAAYTVDLPPWVPSAASAPMSAADGAFDANAEDVQAVIDTQELTPGRHTVYVRGRDADGNWGPVSAVFIEIVAVQAGFTSSSPDMLGETTVFTDTSYGEDLNPVWDFGDDSPASTQPDPIHTYAAAGTYTVTLTVTNTLWMDVYTDTVEIWDDIFYFPVMQK